MNEVLSSYFESSHRGLQKAKQNGGYGDDGYGGQGQGLGSVALPPLLPGGGSGSSGGEYGQLEAISPNSGGGGGGSPGTREQAIISITEERYEQTLRENERLERKLKQVQDQLAITSAKKQAFKSEAMKLQKELGKTKETFDTLQRETETAREEHQYWAMQSKEAVSMMNEMRKTHIQEVRLLQKGLQARTDDKLRNRVNEVADLVDKLGRAVVQRDEAVKEKTKLQAQVHQLKVECKALQESNKKGAVKIKQLEARLAKSNKSLALQQPAARGVGGVMGMPDLSDDEDEEFEAELQAFERRYTMLDEGAKGVDQWVEKLQKDKQKVERFYLERTEAIVGLEKSVHEWQSLCEAKDQKIHEVSKKLSDMQKDHARLDQQIASKQKEIELQIEAEREGFEGKLRELQTECDHARSTAQGYQALSDKLQNELLKVSDNYTKLQFEHGNTSDEGQMQPGMRGPMGAAAQPGMGEQQGGGVSPYPPSGIGSEPEILDRQLAREAIYLASNKVLMDAYGAQARLTRSEAFANLPAVGSAQGGPAPGSPQAQPITAEWQGEAVLMAQQAQFAKTGELLQLEVWRTGAEVVMLKAHELSTNERYEVPLDQDLLEELDAEDPWTELFGVVGISLGPPKQLVLPKLVGRRELPLPPAGVALILTIYKYDNRRFFLNGFDAANQRLVDLVVMEEHLGPEHGSQIDHCRSFEVLFDFFVANLTLHAGSPPKGGPPDAPGALRLVFADGTTNAGQGPKGQDGL